MASSVIAGIFVSVDGWAGSDGLPGYFGYLGPELQEWILDELAAPQLVVMGGRVRLMTFPLLAGPSGRDAAFAANWVKTFHGPEPEHPYIRRYHFR